ncbi:NTF2 fold immunity protein [Mucilaginibacter gossypiicola]|uniref:NTF2 fold immunity protein n=1 Tax=Mucilaginibacter gossypiicola TaxID=551995 RepID=A0A1H8NPU3_9SPHI|nr:NTF2 fold immunity protein [Mucilaginibacter gossypiicola]SEO31600.1 NTF2 fold immunity protein [Mucilaginibacter gossypiicola]
MNTIKKGIFYLVFFGCLILINCSLKYRVKRQEARIPKVPDEKTAIKIAEAVWLPIYGESIYQERPFTATLNNGVWYVYGCKPDSALGGVAEIKIRKSDCKILWFQHLK